MTARQVWLVVTHAHKQPAADSPAVRLAVRQMGVALLRESVPI